MLDLRELDMTKSKDGRSPDAAYSRCDLVSAYTAEQSCKIDSCGPLRTVDMYSKFVKIGPNFLSHLRRKRWDGSIPPASKKVGWEKFLSHLPRWDRNLAVKKVHVTHWQIVCFLLELRLGLRFRRLSSCFCGRPSDMI